MHGGAGFYVHVEPGASVIGAGIWMPSKLALDKIRDRLLDDHEELAAILAERNFRRRYGNLSKEAMLKRMPRGVDPDHPAGVLLRYKSFTVHRMLTDDQITDPRLPDRLVTDLERLVPFIRWLNNTVGFANARRRL